MNNGWELSAQAWIDSMGERGDWAREHVLDPVMLGRVTAGRYGRALDVGCGEGRFCRMLKAVGVAAIGIDPTHHLLEVARRRDPAGDYRMVALSSCNSRLLISIWLSATSHLSTSLISERR